LTVAIEAFWLRPRDEYSVAAFDHVVATVSFGSFQMRLILVAVAISAVLIWSR
jgi:hypothetical protein